MRKRKNPYNKAFKRLLIQLSLKKPESCDVKKV